MADGWTSRVKSIEKGRDAVDLAVLERQGRQALAVLGVSDVDYCRFPDNRFDTLPMLDLVKVIEEVKNQYMPEVIYTNSAFDLSVDQQKTCRAVVTAFRPQPNDNLSEIYCFEVLSSTEWNQAEGIRTFSPNYFVDVEKTLDIKIRAFQQMSLETRSWPHSRSLDAVNYLAKSRGSSVGLAAAEAFVLLRAVKVLDH